MSQYTSEGLQENPRPVQFPFIYQYNGNRNGPTPTTNPPSSDDVLVLILVWSQTVMFSLNL